MSLTSQGWADCRVAVEDDQQLLYGFTQKHIIDKSFSVFIYTFINFDDFPFYRIQFVFCTPG